MQETTNLQKTMSIQACTERVQKIVAVSYPCAKAYVHSFGCQLNVSDGEKIKGLLQSMGFSLTETHEDADVIVFNTCAVRESAEDRVYGMLGVMKKYKETHPRTILILSGCMGSEPKTLEKVRAHYSFIDILMGTASIGELPRLLATYYDTKKFVYDMDSTAMPSEQMQQVRNSGFKASVPIMYGCNNFCTYCIVPYVRGRERSRQPEVILREVQHLIQDGYKEIMLLGQNVNSYGLDVEGELSFAQLLAELDKVGIERIRFMTSHPKDISDELCRYLIFITDGMMTTLGPEIQKVANYCTTPAVARSDIDAMVTPALKARTFDISNAIAGGEYERALTGLRELFAMQEDCNLILGAIGSQMRRLHYAKTIMACGKGQDVLMELTGLKSYPAGLTMTAARRASEGFCRRAVELCLQTDVRMKTSYDDPERLLELLVVELAQEARRG